MLTTAICVSVLYACIGDNGERCANFISREGGRCWWCSKKRRERLASLRCGYSTCPTPTKGVRVGEDGIPRCRWHAYEAASGLPVRPEATHCEAPGCSELARYLTYDDGRWCLRHFSAWTTAARRQNREAGLCACGAGRDEGYATCTRCREANRGKNRAARRRVKRAAKRARRARERAT